MWPRQSSIGTGDKDVPFHFNTRINISGKHEVVAFTPHSASWKCMINSYILINCMFKLWWIYLEQNIAWWRIHTVTMTKGQSGAVLCERVCLCEAEWLTRVFTLRPFWHTVSEQTNNAIRTLFQTKFSMKHLLIYQLLLVLHRLFFFSSRTKSQFCYTVVFLSDNNQFDCYALNTHCTVYWANSMQRREACS